MIEQHADPQETGAGAPLLTIMPSTGITITDREAIANLIGRAMRHPIKIRLVNEADAKTETKKPRP